MYGPRIALWAAGAAGFVLTAVFFSAGSPVPGAVCLVVALTAPGAAEAYADRRKRNSWFASRFASFEDFRASVDTAAVRRQREEEGAAAAVRGLRKRYPLLPLAEAARLVREA